MRCSYIFLDFSCAVSNFAAMHCCRPHRARRLVHKARAPFRGPGSMGSHPQGRTNTNPRDTERPQRHENQQKGPRKKRRAVRGCPRPSPSTSLKRSARACGARAALALYREGPGLDCKILLEAKKIQKTLKSGICRCLLSSLRFRFL